MRRLAALTSLAALLATTVAAAPAATLSPDAAYAGGVQYDEVNRVVAGPAPADADTFAADADALLAAASAQQQTAQTQPQAPKKRGLLGSLGSVAGVAGMIPGVGALAAAGNLGTVASLATTLGTLQNVASIANLFANGGGKGAVTGMLQGFLIPGMTGPQAYLINGFLSAAQGAPGAQQRNTAQTGGAQANAAAPVMRGTLHRRAILANGWMRDDDLLAQTATIVKDGQIVTLDLRKKTYVVHGAADGSARTANAGGAQPAPQPAPPGTAQAAFSTTSSALGARKLAGLDAYGYRVERSAAITGATGSCSEMRQESSELAYFAHFAIPAPRAPGAASAANGGGASAGGGCVPTVKSTASGPNVPWTKFTLYHAVTMNAASGPMTVITERGNVKPLGNADASLFEIPAGFTQAQS
jgi:hypothetical protein